MSTNPLTQELRRDLREACLEHDDPRAFAVLEKILVLDPHDENAQEQKKSIGKRLVEEHAEELLEASRQSDIVPMRQMVSMLRRWADEGTLQRMDGYSVMAARVDEEQKALHRAELSKLLQVLQKTTSVAAREKMAGQAERKASENGVDFTQSELDLLASVHAAFQEDEKARELAERVGELDEEVSVLQANFKSNRRTAPSADLAKLETRLSQIIVLLSGELSSAAPESLQKTVCRLHTLARGEQVQRRQRRLVRAVFSSIATGVILLALGFTAYCYAMVGEATAELEAIRMNKQSIFAREALASMFMPRIYCAIDEKYAAERKTLIQWYKKLCQLRDDYRMTLNTIRGFPSITPDNINDYFVQLDKLSSLAAAAEKDYGDSLGSEPNGIPAELIQPVTDCVKTLLKTYDVIPNDLSKEDIVKRLQYMRNLQRQFKDEERVDISMIPDLVNQHQQALRAQLNKLAENNLDAALDFYRRYEGELALPSGWSREWEQEKNKRISIEQKIKSLNSCSSLNQFVDSVREIRAAKPDLPNCCDESLLIRIAEEGQAAVLRLRINQLKKEIVLDKGELKNAQELVMNLETVYDIYKNKSSLYAGHYTGTIGRAIENMYQPLYRTKRPLAIINDRNGEYVAICEHKGGGYLVHMLDCQEHEVDNFTPQNGKKVNLSAKTHLDSMGVVRSNLQRGSMIPADVMGAIARYTNDDFPTYARVYLFKLAVEWIDTLPAMNAGKAFSPSMRKDLKAFKEKVARENICKGCWYEAHRAEDVAAWKNFFTRLARADYKKEIISNLQELRNVKPEFAGYIDEKGKTVTLRSAKGRLGYFREMGDHLELVPLNVTQPACFTPLFRIP